MARSMARCMARSIDAATAPLFTGLGCAAGFGERVVNRPLGARSTRRKACPKLLRTAGAQRTEHHREREPEERGPIPRGLGERVARRSDGAQLRACGAERAPRIVRRGRGRAPRRLALVGLDLHLSRAERARCRRPCARDSRTAGSARPNRRAPRPWGERGRRTFATRGPCRSRPRYFRAPAGGATRTRMTRGRAHCSEHCRPPPASR